ncbi:MTH1187 family thiamine-binding protein [bacterium]|nr:MTH1187 family thiamine-binding protein [bacterium]
MAVVEVSIVPVGPAGASISKHVAHCLDILDTSGLSYELHPMGTVIEGDLDEILRVVQEMHKGTFGGEVVRVLTSIKIDDRLDKPLTMNGKLEAVRRHRER